MKANRLNKKSIIQLVTASAALILSASALSASLSPMVDSFDDSTSNSLNLPRQLITDSMAGGNSTAQYDVENGVVKVKGDITPARGQLGWVSFVLPLDAEGGSQSAANYEGVLLKIKLTQGSLSVQVNSSDVANHDYHAAPVTVKNDGEFHDVKLPFKSLKRAWSEQTPLDLDTVNAISIVAYGVQPGSFNYELDEIRFY